MEQTFAAAPHQDVLTVLIQVTVLLLIARALGEVAQRLGQPVVIGEILAGVVLGPSLLSGLVPMLGQWLVPQTANQAHMLEVFSMLGALFMLLITGLEIDLMLIRRQARSAIGTGIGGLVVPFAGGLLLAGFLPDDLLTDPQHRFVFSLFVATAISASAIPVIAKVLMDLDLIRRDFGQILISAAMLEDAIAWTILSVILALAREGTVTVSSLAMSIGSVLVFAVISFTLGRWIVKKSLHFVQNEVKLRNAILSLVIVLMFAWGAFSQALHLEPVIGAFAIGILFSRMPNLPDEVISQLEMVALGIFAPIFFAVAGLKVNLLSLLEPRLFAIAVLVIAVAAVTKIAGAYFGARLMGGRDHWTALSFGIGLNTHGAIEIIIATIGLSAGILTQNMFSIIVLMSIVTSLTTPFALRWVLTHVRAEEQEIERLRREELLRDNLFANVHRVLVPVRRRGDGSLDSVKMIEARILQHIAPGKKLSVTLLNVAEDGDRAAGTKFLNNVGTFFPAYTLNKKVVVSSDPLGAILDEARKDYDLVVIGATGRTGDTEILFNPMVDGLVRLSPCPSIVVHSKQVPEDWAPRRILAPTNGSIASRRAVQAAFSLVANNDGEVLILKVVNVEAMMCYLDARETILERQYIIAHQIVDELGAMGQSLGVQTYTAVQPGPDPETVIFEVARSTNADLIILGTNVRAGSERLYLGSRVERILHHAPCPVIIVNPR